jgi:hypothetical protein
MRWSLRNLSHQNLRINEEFQIKIRLRTSAVIVFNCVETRKCSADLSSKTQCVREDIFSKRRQQNSRWCSVKTRKNGYLDPVRQTI